MGVVEYGLNNVVAVEVLLPVLLLVVLLVALLVVSSVGVSVVAVGTAVVGVSGGNSVAVEVPIGVSVDVVVLMRRTPEDVAVVDDVVNDPPDGRVECRDVCTTANTMRTTATRPATPAATAMAGR